MQRSIVALALTWGISVYCYVGQHDTVEDGVT